MSLMPLTPLLPIRRLMSAAILNITLRATDGVATVSERRYVAMLCARRER